MAFCGKETGRLNLAVKGKKKASPFNKELLHLLKNPMVSASVRDALKPYVNAGVGLGIFENL